MEFFRSDETSDETELETRLCPVAENKETAGDAGAEVLIVNGDMGWRDISSSEWRVASIVRETLYMMGVPVAVEMEMDHSSALARRVVKGKGRSHSLNRERCDKRPGKRELKGRAS
jgi:hypothetical protein